MKKNGLHIDDSGNKCWFKDDKFHRCDGPAIDTADGCKQWYVDGIKHRLDGPAVEWSDGSTAWFKDGDFLGNDDKGLWRLWDLLTNEQRNNINLLMRLLKVQK